MSLLTAGRLDYVTFKGPFQPKAFYDSMKLVKLDRPLAFRKRVKDLLFKMTSAAVFHPLHTHSKSLLLERTQIKYPDY